MAVLTADRFPAPLADDHEPPAVLFARGDPSVLDRPRVAIVGTRRCTAASGNDRRSRGHNRARNAAGTTASSRPCRPTTT